ncbi:MAG: Bug family tripartite tricarboxylate transporter substrate binding protein [Betaproteobacteria bacterium]
MTRSVRSAAVLAALFTALTAGIAPGLAEAQTWPNRPVRLVVTFPTGGAPDILARLFSDKAQLGQPIIVDNRPGAGGNIGADFVAKSAPDGYTLVMGTVGTHAINGGLYAKMPYDMVRDFSPVSLVASAPNLLVVNNNLPVKTVSDLISYMKANPDKLSFGSPGVGTSVHVSGELFKTMTGTTMTHVPYKGRQFAIPDLVGGSIQLMFDNMPSALPMAREGKIRAVAVTTLKRSASAPEIPTVAETLPGFEAVTWFAMFAPAGTPRAAIDRLHQEVLRVYRLPDVQERMQKLGLDAVLSTPEELATYQAAEISKWGDVVKKSGARAE